jgi:hypothetical protein
MTGNERFASGKPLNPRRSPADFSGCRGAEPGGGYYWLLRFARPALPQSIVDLVGLVQTGSRLI